MKYFNVNITFLGIDQAPNESVIGKKNQQYQGIFLSEGYQTYSTFIGLISFDGIEDTRKVRNNI